MVVTVTEKAITELKRLISEYPEHAEVALRIRVVGGGCSGFSTKLDLDEEFNEEKDHLNMVDGVRVAIDKRSALYLEGASVDFHEGLDKRGFVVNNPNAKTTCGCGSSFSM